MSFGSPAARSLSQEQFEQIRSRLRHGMMATERRVVSRRALLRPRVLVLASIVVLLALAAGVLATIALQASGTSSAVKAEREWRHELAVGVRENPDVFFPNLSPEELKARLESTSRTYGFEVISLTLLKPRGLAPLVVVKSNDEKRFSHQLPSILKVIDPREPGAEDGQGWAFEGFFLKAVNAEGDPFIVVFNFWRGDSPGGGQWARTRALLPFETAAVPVGEG